MSDILPANIPSDSVSTTSAPRSDVDWTVVGSTPTSPSQSTTSPSPPLSSRPSTPSEEVATITPSSPAQSLVESDDAKPQSLSSLATDDLISPIATPLPASPVDEGGLAEGTEVSTPINAEWARSKLGISEGQDDGKSSIGGSDTEQAVETEKEKEGERKAEEEKGDESKDVREPKEDETSVPSLIFTKPTLSGNEVVAIAEQSELPYTQPKKENETSDDSDKTDVAPPAVNRINTRLVPSFLHDTQDQLFESPTTTNNAAPNSAVSPKTSSFFFDTSRVRSPPRQGGATIVELPSDADTLGAESDAPRNRTVVSNETQTSDEEQEDQEKPSSHSTGTKTMPLISPDQSSDRPSDQKAPMDSTRSPRPPHLSRKPSPHYVSTFSRDHSPAPRPHLVDRSRSKEYRRRFEDEEASSTPHHDSFFRSRTFVSASAPPKHRKSRPVPVEKKEEEVKKPMSMSSLVEEIKGALAGDSTTYYTLKGILAEYEEKKRSSESRGDVSAKKERAVKRKESDPDVEFVEREKAKFLHRQAAKTKPSAPVKSFSYTQTDTDSSDIETYKLPKHHRRSSSFFLRQLVLPSLTGQPQSAAVPQHHKSVKSVEEEEAVELRRAQQGSRAVPLRTAPPHSPVYPSRLSPRPSHTHSSTTRPTPPSTGAKSSTVLKSVKLAKPVSALEASSRLALEKQLFAAAGKGIPSSPPRTTSSTSALRNRPDLSPQKRAIAKVTSPSRPLVPASSTERSKPFEGGRFIFFNYTDPGAKVEQVDKGAKSVAREKKGEGDRKRRSEGRENGERRKRLVMKEAKMEGKRKMGEKGKGKEKERENSISFDVDDFF